MKKKILRILGVIFGTYLSTYLISLLVINDPNWWNTPTVIFLIIGLVLLWIWVINQFIKEIK